MTSASGFHILSLVCQAASDTLPRPQAAGRCKREPLDHVVREGSCSFRERKVGAKTGASAKGWQQADFERDKQLVAERKFTEGADEVLVNGDSFIAGARALEPIFKARMFAPVEA